MALWGSAHGCISCSLITTILIFVSYTLGILCIVRLESYYNNEYYMSCICLSLDLTVIVQTSMHGLVRNKFYAGFRQH